jgi:hypothetical protein
MFCTAEEAARKLDATETELEILMEEGILPEFRDGASRFLRIADVDALLARQGGVALQAPPERESPFELGGSACDMGSTPSEAEEIRLPACATVRVKTEHPESQPAATAPQRRASAVRADMPPRQPSAPRREPRPDICRAPSVSALPAYPAKPQTQEMSLRQWLWTGVRDDRPHTLIALALSILAGVCGVIGAVYLLAQAL